jgi:hypothetical protein
MVLPTMMLAGMLRRLAPARARAVARYVRDSHLCWRDVTDLANRPSVAAAWHDASAGTGVRPGDAITSTGPVRFLRRTRYLNGAHAVVTHSVDDASEYMAPCLDALDKFGIKATAFIDIQAASPSLWARLRLAIANGHEVGGHSRRHRCRFPETAAFCFLSLNRFEIRGSRDDIVKHTGQPYVWSWAYPCGNCAGRRIAQLRVARAGYIVARAYSDGAPGLQTWDANPYAALFTQVVQKSHEVVWKGEKTTLAGRTDVPKLNAKFDEVYAAGGIYSFVSHPQWLDYGAESFYEQHLAHIGGRDDVWYVPMGPLYAYRVLSEHTSIRQLPANDASARFAVSHRLDPSIYNGSITLEFQASARMRPLADGQTLPERARGPVQRWEGQYYRRAGQSLLLTIRPNSIVEFR